jgi:hypothetical protein
VTLLKKALGLLPSQRETPHTYHDLDRLAGTWSREEYLRFQRELDRTRVKDAELWR